ncbi:bile acid:sodium symporter family protein [Methanofollis aquaemaris]|uniref:Bile acid:sodium symporter family protein n=1 Tax=Methanofollis aquaemaris TaxID=126734 RepID=A0A8A3S410_9EURY|nr:hypothetical protein [Methanofollis aquaemaris]QSZ66376.1 bile acid:sodium symporter family protein [Methanofollis aquaemaris]
MVETVSFIQFLESIGYLAVLVFVVCSMLAMGFTLTVPEILEPLRDRRLVARSLAANFVLVPLLAVVLLVIFPLTEGLAIGLLLIGCAAGAPFLPKLAEVAKGDRAFSVGLMVLLMVVTIAYLPLVLPLALPGIAVSPWEIARSLVFLMLLPLALALGVRARYQAIATGVAPVMSRASGLALVVLMIAFFVAYLSDLLGVIGSTAVLAAAIFLLISCAVGYVLGGKIGGIRRVLAVGTAQRNLAAATAVAAVNFTDPDVIVMVLVVGLIGLVILMVVGGEMGRRA